MSGLRIAVTGGSGQVGGAVVRCLLARGHQVVNLDLRQAAKPLTRFVRVDLTRRDQVQPILEQVDAVAHLGEIPNLGAHPPAHVYAHNTAAGATVLQTACDLGIKRVVYTSTIQVYGLTKPCVVPPLTLPVDERHPLQPQQAYALSKAANEQYAANLAHYHGLQVAVFRLPWTSAWRIAADGQSEIWPEMLIRLGTLDDLGAYVHADDAALAYALVLENPRPGWEAYQLCAAEGMFDRPIRPWLQQVFPALPALPTDWPAFRSPYVADKLRDHCGWAPTWNLLDFYRARFGCDPRPG